MEEGREGGRGANAERRCSISCKQTTALPGLTALVLKTVNRSGGTQVKPTRVLNITISGPKGRH